MYVDFSEYHVITPEKISKSMSELRINSRTLAFTMVTASELGYPERVNLLASPDGQTLVLTGNYDFDKGSIPFCSPDMDRNKKMISIRAKQFVAFVRKEFGWDDKRARKIYGTFFRDEGFIAFDLRKALFLNKRKKGAVPVSLSDYPTFRDIKESYKPCLYLPSASSVITL